MRRWVLLLLGCALMLTTLPAHAQSYEWLQVVPDKFDNPVYVTHASDGSGRLFVIEQAGYVWIVQGGLLLDQPFLNIADLLPDEVFRGGYTERGLLGLAFHPQYRENGHVFISYTRRDQQNIVARYQVSSTNPNQIDPTSEVILLSFVHPEMNHNGGMLAFGKDGYLTIAVGDGGGDQGDPSGNAQNPASLLGKLLRIDVNADRYTIPPDNPFRDHPTARPEVWALGLRNPWRFSFDRDMGDLYIGDVGWGNWEEINHVAAGTAGGLNFGWNVYEGTHLLPGKADPGGLQAPIAEYDHQGGACSVTGGYVVRGPGAPSLRGRYVFGDYCTGRVWTLARDDQGAWQARVLMETGMQITSFGEDERGGLYLVSYKGYIYRLRER
jgi:glucose/arabinose dehydrogenase